MPPTLCRCRKLESLGKRTIFCVSLVILLLFSSPFLTTDFYFFPLFLSSVLSNNPFTKCLDLIQIVEKNGIQGFLSHCRERRAREIRGAPPDGTIQVHHGVNDELSQLDIRQVTLCSGFCPYRTLVRGM